MDHYTHRGVSDAKFEAVNFFSFGDMTSQNFPQKKGTSHQIRLFTPEKRVFMSRIVLLDPKLTSHVNFRNFQAENFHFQKSWEVSIRKIAAVTPLIDQFC